MSSDWLPFFKKTLWCQVGLAPLSSVVEPGSLTFISGSWLPFDSMYIPWCAMYRNLRLHGKWSGLAFALAMLILLAVPWSRRYDFHCQRWIAKSWWHCSSSCILRGSWSLRRSRYVNFSPLWVRAYHWHELYRVGELLSVSDTAGSPYVSSGSVLRLPEECQSWCIPIYRDSWRSSSRTTLERHNTEWSSPNDTITHWHWHWHKASNLCYSCISQSSRWGYFNPRSPLLFSPSFYHHSYQRPYFDQRYT